MRDSEKTKPEARLPNNNTNYERDLVFFLNGRRVELRDVSPVSLLVDYLRSPDIGLTGTKIGCKQGGCGACTVIISSFDPRTKQVTHRSINSCMRPLAALDGALVTTVEGTGSVKDGLVSPVQYCLAKNNGTQCGFCTPGWIMNMTAAVATKGPKPGTQREIEGLFDGNLCRCTGYRPILYGFKKDFASDWDPKVDQKGCMACLVDPAEDVAHAPAVTVDFPAALRRPPRAVAFERDGYKWFRPLSLREVLRLLREHRDSANVRLVVGNTSIGIYPRTVEDPHVFIDIAHVPELQQAKVTKSGLILGSALTYGELIAWLGPLIAAAKKSKSPRLPGLDALNYLAGRTAGTIVRNAASLAGNTMLVVRHVNEGVPFPSDLFTALSSLGAEVLVMSPRWKSPRWLALLDFAAQWQSSKALQDGAVVVAYRVPFTRAREFAQTYKCALREVNAHSIVNAGMRVRFDVRRRVTETSVVVGGIAPVAVHLRRVEQFLAGRVWDAATLAGALALVREDVDALFKKFAARYAALPFEGFTDDYKRHLAESFFYKFFVATAEWLGESVPPEVRTAGERFERPVSRGTQHYRKYPAEYPANEPFIKLEAFLQTTGEAQYTHDIPLPRRGLAGAFVQSTVALGTCAYRVPGVKGHATPADVLRVAREKFPGVVDFVTAVDVPGPVFQGLAGDDPVFAVSCTEAQCNNGSLPKNYNPARPVWLSGFGQCIGLVVAENEQVAQEAAWFIQTSLCDFKSGTPVIEIPKTDAAREAIAFKDQPPGAPWYSHIWQITRAGSELDWVPARAMDRPDPAVPSVQRAVSVDGVNCRVVSSAQAVGSQIHFYMETQSCYVEPLEDRQVRVFPSSQDPDTIQATVCKTLGLPANKVNVRVRRIGGGYGGKCGQSAFVAAAAAAAAWKLNRPVLVAALRQVDTAMFGHRHPVLGNFNVAIGDASDPAAHGRLLGFQSDFWLDGGRTRDCSFIVSDCLSLRSDNAYLVPNWNCKSDVCRTDKTSNTSMRTMGMIQAALIVEEAVEAAAHSVGLRPEEVRARNLYQQGDTTPYGEKLRSCYMREVWKFAEKKSDFRRRRAEVDEFNARNRWRKRGLSLLPLKYGSGFNLAMLEQGGALIEVYDQDATVLVHHGGVEMGQGLNTKVAQVVAETLNVSLAIIRVAEMDTGVVPNPESTGASTGTSFNAGAAQKACRELRARLEAFCLGLRKKKGDAWCEQQHINYWDYPAGWRATPKGATATVWQSIASLAFANRLNLSAQARVRIRGGTKPDTGLTFHEVDGKPATEEVDYFNGYTFSAACAEVEVDVLTGETTILRADIIYDAGRSLNPAVDVGQIEGGFVQGCGYVLSEDFVYQPEPKTPHPPAGLPSPGALYTVNTWEYKPPAATSIPLEMNVTMFPREMAANAPQEPGELLSSKEIGEPPMTLAASVFFAVKHAILAARRDRGHDEWFQMESPATVQRIREACLVDGADLKL